MNESILQEAENLVNGDRAKAYGSATESFGRIANITNNLLTDEEKKGHYITPIMVCKMLVALKLSRQVHAHKRDNLVDLAGYSKLWNDLEQDKPKG